MVIAKKEPVIEEATLGADDLLCPKIKMFYGPTGTGKTVSASTYPKPQVWIDMDRGMDSILWAMKQGICPHKPEDFNYVRPKNVIDERGKLISATGMWQVIDKINEWMERPQDWNTMVLDSTTTLNHFAMTAGMEVSGKYPTEAKPFSKSGEFTKAAGILLFQIQDYRPAQSFIDQLVEPLKIGAHDLRKWIILISHEYEITRASKEIGVPPTVVGVEPAMWGQQRKNISARLDEVYYFKQEGTKTEPKHLMQTRGDGFTVAKTRFGCFDVKEEPNWPNLHKKIKAFYGRGIEQ